MKNALYPICLLAFMHYSAQAGVRWNNFCEKYIVADDPYQYAHLSADQLVDVYWRFKGANYHSRVLINEIKFRVRFKVSPYEDIEILTKTLANEEK